LGLAALVLLAGCRADTRVEITMHGDGSGVLSTTVTLDADAVQQLGGQKAATAQLPLAQLHDAGWTVDPWRATADGGGSVRFTTAFDNQQELQQRLHDLVGAQGILRDAHLTHSRGLFSSKDGVSLVVDMRSPQTGIGSDADLKARLKAAGVDPATLDAQFAAQLRGSLHLTVVLKTPDGKTTTYTPSNGTIKTVSVSRQSKYYDRMVKYGIALTLALLAGLFLLAAYMSSSRNRRRQRQRNNAFRDEDRVPLM
jgi:hypothetical protein